MNWTSDGTVTLYSRNSGGWSLYNTCQHLVELLISTWALENAFKPRKSPRIYICCYGFYTDVYPDTISIHYKKRIELSMHNIIETQSYKYLNKLFGYFQWNHIRWHGSCFVKALVCWEELNLLDRSKGPLGLVPEYVGCTASLSHESRPRDALFVNDIHLDFLWWKEDSE